MATTKHGAWSQPTSQADQADQAATLEDSNMANEMGTSYRWDPSAPLRSPQKTNSR